jgi:hypothetical protein
MDHRKVETPMCILIFTSLSIAFSQLPNILVIFEGEEYYVKYIMCQIIRAKGHERNKCSTISIESKKTTLATPIPFSFS